MFGKDHSRENYFSKTRRVKVVLFNINYGFYASAGIKVKAQQRKRIWFVRYWVNYKVNQMAVGIGKLKGTLNFNEPPSQMNPTVNQAWGIFEGVFTGYVRRFITNGYQNIGIINDWTPKILSFLPEYGIDKIGPFNVNIDKKIKDYAKGIIDAPADHAYKFLMNQTGAQIWINGVKKRIFPDEPRGLFVLNGYKQAVMYANGVKEYGRMSSKCIRFDQSFGLSTVTGFFLPTTFKIEEIDIFGAIYTEGQWKGCRFYKK